MPDDAAPAHLPVPRDPDRGFDALLLDMDGVLCESEALTRDAAKRLLKDRYDLDVDDQAFKPFVGAGEARFLAGAARHPGGPDSDRGGVDIDVDAELPRLYDLYERMVKGRLEAMPGAAACVERCHALGLPVVVASSANHRKVQANLHAIGLAPARFSALVVGEDVERKKPDPAVFLLAAERVGVAPERCVVVEDALRGVEAARRAGMRAIGMTTSFSAEALRDAGAVATITSLAEWVRTWDGG